MLRENPFFFDVGSELQLAPRGVGEHNPGNKEFVFGVEDTHRSYDEPRERRSLLRESRGRHVDWQISMRQIFEIPVATFSQLLRGLQRENRINLHALQR